MTYWEKHRRAQVRARPYHLILALIFHMARKVPERFDLAPRSAGHALLQTRRQPLVALVVTTPLIEQIPQHGRVASDLELGVDGFVQEDTGLGDVTGSARREGLRHERPRAGKASPDVVLHLGLLCLERSNERSQAHGVPGRARLQAVAMPLIAMR